MDRRLGDNADFIHFVEAAHKRDIRIVVDGVFNHTGREFFAFQDILKNRQNSPYCSWYKGINFGWNSPYNDGFGYEAWRNCFELANLNYWEPQVRQYILDVIRFWIDTFDIDGIRLDCADCLEFSFLQEMRRCVDEKKPDFWLMGEVIHGDYSRYVTPDKLNSVTNYELHKGLYSGHNDHNYFEIAPVFLYGCLYLKKVVFSSGVSQWDDFYGFNRNGKWRISFSAMLVGAFFVCILLWGLCKL